MPTEQVNSAPFNHDDEMVITHRRAARTDARKRCVHATGWLESIQHLI